MIESCCGQPLSANGRCPVCRVVWELLGQMTVVDTNALIAPAVERIGTQMCIHEDCTRTVTVHFTDNAAEPAHYGDDAAGWILVYVPEFDILDAVCPDHAPLYSPAVEL